MVIRHQTGNHSDTGRDRMNRHEEAVKAIESIIKITTPKASCRGRQDRNKLVKNVLQQVKSMTFDKRVNKP